ncbi:MAG: hypothetical protein L0Y67_00545 [Gammaproteobacteria bacterium]|nr:hypothetical protein [Gammaproteobacteria bacterium]MCI0590093.1 hypothetical protein [Gammaproteobacteria bacterium]
MNIMKKTLYASILLLTGALVSGEVAADGFQPWASDASSAESQVIGNPAELRTTPWYLQGTNGRPALGEDGVVYEKGESELVGFHPWYVG